MILAQQQDFEKVKEIFYQHKQWFPHVRTDYMRREIDKGHIVLDREVIITYNFYKKKQSIGNVLAQQGDCILHQIAAKNKDGSASEVLQRFFKWTERRVFLSVRSDNIIAKKFYEKNNMKLIGKTSWARGTLPGDVYLYDAL
jgi:RimJ/RimL family protein N-acetyltransferase